MEIRGQIAFIAACRAIALLFRLFVHAKIDGGHL